MKFDWEHISVKYIQVRPKSDADVSYVLKDAIQLALQEMVNVTFTTSPLSRDAQTFVVDPLRVIHLAILDQEGYVQTTKEH